MLPRALGLIAYLAGVTSAPASAQAQASGSHIVTSATARRALAPDQANISIGIEVHAATAGQASAQLVTRLSHLRDVLSSFPAPLDSIQTLVFNVGPNFSYAGTRTLVDYQGTAVLRVSLRALETLGRLVDTTFAAGATEIPSILFTSDSAGAVRRRLLATALDEARADAEALAVTAGRRLGPALQIATSREDGSERVHYLRGGNFVGSAGTEDSGPGYRSVLVEVTVQSTWQLLPPAR